MGELCGWPLPLLKPGSPWDASCQHGRVGSGGDGGGDFDGGDDDGDGGDDDGDGGNDGGGDGGDDDGGDGDHFDGADYDEVWQSEWS